MVSSSYSFVLYFENNTPFTLKRKEANVKVADWFQGNHEYRDFVHPPESMGQHVLGGFYMRIAQTGMQRWAAEGPQGEVLYRVETGFPGNPDVFLRVKFWSPYSGKNTIQCSMEGASVKDFFYADTDVNPDDADPTGTCYFKYNQNAWPQMGAEILSVKLADPLCPVVDEHGVAPYFASNSQTLWDPDINNKKAVPGAFDVLSHHNSSDRGPFVNLSLRVKVYGGLPSISTKLRGDAKIAGWAGMMHICEMVSGTSPKPISGRDGEYTYCMILRPYQPGGDDKRKKWQAEARPWAFIKDIHWWFEVVKYSLDSYWSVACKQPTPVELYGLSPAIPTYLFREGIPANLLRFAFPADREADKYWEEDYSTYITNRVFRDTGFIYDVWTAYFSFVGGAGWSFNLHKWLELRSHIAGVPKSNTHDDSGQREIWRIMGGRPTVNCIDQAGILLICLSLSFRDDGDWSQLKCYNTSPFGFIGPPCEKDGKAITGADLVGWGMSNSPLFKGDRNKMIMGRKEKDRTSFGSHIFFSWKNKVYDACAGPHCGTETLEQYLANALDHEHPPVEKYDEKTKQKRFLKEEEIYADIKNEKDWVKVHDAARNKHGGALGALEDAVSLRTRRNWPPAELRSNVGNKELWLDAFDLKTSLSKYESMLVCSGKKINILADSKPTWHGGEGTLDVIHAGRIGLLDWTLKASYDGKEYSVEVQWRIFDTFEHAAATMRATADDQPELEPDQVEEGKLLLGKSTDGSVVRNIWMVLHGKHKLQVHSEMPAEALKCLAATIYKFVDDDTKKEKQEDADAQKNDDLSLTMETGKTTTIEVWTKHVRDFDWSYDHGGVFLKDWSCNNGTYKFTLYGRKSTHALENGVDYVNLVFFNRYFKEIQRRIKVRVHARH